MVKTILNFKIFSVVIIFTTIFVFSLGCLPQNALEMCEIGDFDLCIRGYFSHLKKMDIRYKDFAKILFSEEGIKFLQKNCHKQKDIMGCLLLVEGNQNTADDEKGVALFDLLSNLNSFYYDVSNDDFLSLLFGLSSARSMYKKFIKALKKGCKLNVAWACMHLGGLYGDIANKIDIRDYYYKRTVEIYKNGCFKNEEGSMCYKLGVLYFSGRIYNIGEQMDPKKLIEKACEKDKSTCYSVGELYMHGQYVKRDIEKASYFLAIACEEENIAKACYQLGELARERDEAIHYHSLACALDYVQSCYRLGDIYREEQSYSLAADYYNKSCELGDANSCFRMGEIYESRQIFPGDDERAIYFYQLACELGVSYGCEKSEFLNNKIGR